MEAKVVDIDEDYINLTDLSCVDADGNIFEKYSRLKVQKDPLFYMENTFTGAACLKDVGLFLPSMALSCNILRVLYNYRADKEVRKVLEQYGPRTKGYGFEASFHSQNTLVDYLDDNCRVVHYPTINELKYCDVPIDGDKSKRIELDFDKSELRDMKLKEFVKIDENRRFYRQLTGLTDIESLIKVADYVGVGRDVVLSFPSWPCAQDEKQFYNSSEIVQNVAVSLIKLKTALGQARSYYVHSVSISVADPGFVLAVDGGRTSMGAARGVVEV